MYCKVYGAPNTSRQWTRHYCVLDFKHTSIDGKTKEKQSLVLKLAGVFLVLKYQS